MGVSRRVVKILKNGLKWKFIQKPILRTSPWLAQENMSPKKQAQMKTVVDKLLEKNAIEEVIDVNSPGYYSILFLRPKPSGEMRPIIDLKALNLIIENQTFTMESARSIQEQMQEGQWATSIDLSDAYFHIPIHNKYKKYLRFAVLGKVYQFRALPFGLAIAPRIFTMIMSEVAKVLRQHGVAIHMYLDDWLIKNNDPRSLSAQTHAILTLCKDLGLIVNLKKSEITPAQGIEFVGVLYDLSVGRAFPPLQRIAKIQVLIQKLLSALTAPASEWLTLIGLLGSVADQVPLGRLHIRPFQFHLSSQWNLAKHSRSVPISVSPQMVEHLKWWIHEGTLEVGVPLEMFNAQVTMFTDASMEGWGAHVNGDEISGKWDTSERELHINQLEMRAITLALSKFAEVVQGKAVLVCTDNTTVLAYVNHQGGTRSISLMQETVSLFQMVQDLKIQIRARHIPGRLNVLADKLSREGQILHTEWSMHPAVLESLWQVWDKPLVDLFATRYNAKLSCFVSPVPDDLAFGVDAMSMSWEGIHAYAYPPTALIRQVLRKIKLHSCKIILIAPYWPEKPWMTELLALSEDPPVPLPLRKDLLKQPQQSLFHQNPAVLALHAWKLYHKQ